MTIVRHKNAEKYFLFLLCFKFFIIIVSFLMIEKETNARYTSFDEFYP